MGCSWCNTTDEIINDSNFPSIKKRLNDEYSSYLSFLNKMKTDLNSSIYNEKNSNNNQLDNIIRKEFNLIPRNWFENWEKRIQYVIDNEKYKSYNSNFEYKDINNITKFYYELMTNDQWSLIYRNPINNIKQQTKLKTGIICNNLIIFQYTKNSNNKNSNNFIEIFFFKNDEDLFFTNLLFSFEKCPEEQKECINLLNRLKKSPIQEIFGNMHYDYSNPKFIEQNKKIIIYNKTSNFIDEIKNFRKRQYDILYKTPSIQGNEKEEENNNNNQNQNENKIESIYSFPNKKDKKYLVQRLNNISNLKGESMTVNELSRASTIMMRNNINMNNNVSSIKIYRQKYNNNESSNENINNTNRNNISPFKQNLMLQNRLDRSKNIFLKKNEISTILDNKNMDKNIGEETNQSFFECILYNLFNIRKLVTYFLNNDINLDSKINSFTNDFSEILSFLFNKNNNKKDKSYNLTELNNNLLKNCPFYNYEKLLNYIMFQNSNNIISNMINVLHSELNKSKKKEELKYNSSEIEVFKEEVYLNKEEKNKEYNTFLNKCNENNKSIIYDLFYGIKEVKITCDICNKSNYKYEMIDTIELSKNKLNKFYIQNKIANNISIEDCLNYYKIKENHQENAFIECPICNDLQTFTVFNKITKYPNVLILYFINNMNTIENEEEIKINISEKIKPLNDEYELIGIISLKNINKINNYEEDKYIAYLKDLSNKNWLLYDNDNNNGKINNIKNNDFIAKINPIVLFYKKI